MIQLYTWGTPNGKKASIMLEEVGLPYEVHAINIGQNDQFKPEYLAINPNNKIPAIVDTDGPGGKPFKLFESGAILMYLAEKSGKFWPADMAQRYTVIQWLMFQMGGVGPMFGQANYFFRLEEKVPYAIERFHKEAKRLYNVLDQAVGSAGISRRRIFHRRHRDLSLGVASRWPSRDAGGLSQRETLVRSDRQAAGGAAGDGDSEEVKTCCVFGRSRARI